MKVWIALFVVMMSLPVLLAMIYFKTRKGKILKIRQDYVKDVRYFGRSFAKMVEKALPELKDGIIQLSKPEAVLEIGEEQNFVNPDIEKLIIARSHKFMPKGEALHFHKEIYCEEDAILTEKEMKLRAIYSRKRILFGNGTGLVRWADSEEAIAVYDHCQLGRRVSSGEQLILGFDNSFHSLYAPMICLGQRPEEKNPFMSRWNPAEFRFPPADSYDYNRHYISHDMISAEGLVPCNIVSKQDVKILEHIIIQGDIHSDGYVRVMEDAVVLGNIFAERDVLLERNAVVSGNVFTQGSIVFEQGASVGQPEKTSSVIARESIEFKGGNTVFGYVQAEGGGRILSQESDKKENRPEYRFPDKIEHQSILKFQNLEEYKNVDMQGFRLDTDLRQADIPDGAVTVPKSQFFGCENLEEISLPDSLTVIEDYAFADCFSLQTRNDMYKSALTVIGISAFENCRELMLSRLPDTLKIIEGAAFAGCISIRKIIFSENAVLKKVGDHAFRGCEKLERVYLPDTTEYVGVSAFMGCNSLKEISVPVTVRTQPGIEELSVNCPDTRLFFRPVDKENVEEGEE